MEIETPEAAQSVARNEARKDARRKAIKKGLVIVNTGHGKGKTTAALGVVLRAWGRGMRICVIQFIKNAGARFGEVRAAEKLGIEWYATGDGFTWTSRDLAASEALSHEAWELAKSKIASGNYDLVVLDEFTYPLRDGWLPLSEVLSWLTEHKPPMLHLIITGRDAPADLIAYADLVTEMRAVKHPFKTQGIRAQPGIEY
jgi:cob(I)alamin adenosyltransferase